MSDEMLTWEEAVQWLREQPDKSELIKYCYYDDPLETAAERFFQSEEWAELISHLKSKSSGEVLDIGAGRGISSYAFAKSGYAVTALEPNPSQLVGAGAIRKLADSSGLAIAVVQDWGETLPFADRTFDIVYGRAVLHHAHDLNLLCKEAARVLKPNGYFVATREHVISQKADLQEFLDSHPLHHLYGGENAYLLEEYTNAITSSGFQIVKTLAPLQSVINYFPMTKFERHNLLELFLTKKLGYIIAIRLSKFKFLQELYTWYISKKVNSPGRLYSFIAIKP
ncbi:methylase involved in ubiquinone/menaquinone biosynthesis [Synechococcus sp. PCC 7502]|uniref:class I SAM-dependent methyltransferase n=1 Tax=Synechococcus sp. PCC 7502 TaxID=1173263 RepID=UPI00029F99DA|nr:class I SAM-dependent methyltransferase [Synechococcus sp. PCC 7502]AFY75123.1 methylase involved in ubiquinone/menaquinone biosynthesis [Synechococcus sp. PCC 7502]